MKAFLQLEFNDKLKIPLKIDNVLSYDAFYDEKTKVKTIIIKYKREGKQ